jgi:glycine dehydrogenase subunit 2
LFNLAKNDAQKLHDAPVSTPVGRLDEVKAARDMRLSYS